MLLQQFSLLDDSRLSQLQIAHIMNDEIYHAAELSMRGSPNYAAGERSGRHMTQYNIQDGGGFHHVYFLIPQEWSIEIHIITILTYAALPIMRLFARYADKRLMEYALALWFLLGILYPTVRTFWPFTLLSGIPIQWRMNMTYASIGYMLLGHYLSVYHPRPNRGISALVLLSGFLLTFWGTCLMSYTAGRPDGHFLEGMGMFVFLVALGMWSLCQTVSLSKSGRKLAGFLSRASFCIYLTHIFFLQAFAQWGLRAVNGPVLLMMPLISGLIICCCCVVYTALFGVSFIRWWLI